MSARILVAGIGNIFLGDDGFGVEVATRLRGERMPDGVRVEEFGIRGVHLAYELLDGYDALVLVDALSLGEQPGTVVVLEPDVESLTGDEAVMDAHTMHPAVVLGTLAHLGGHVENVLVVGCQPAVLDEGIGLSDVVAASVDTAVRQCRELVAALHSRHGKESAA